jgi:uncharacterized membrane protein
MDTILGLLFLLIVGFIASIYLVLSVPILTIIAISYIFYLAQQ